MGGILVKFNDDGEPSGTAGPPMLKILLEKDLSNVLVVVTRYFGGILLGTGGLVRAYSEATISALNKTEVISKATGYEVKIEIEYSNFEQFKYYLTKSNIKIIKTDYLNNIEIIIEVSKEKFTNISNNSNFKILNCDILKEKFIEI